MILLFKVQIFDKFLGCMLNKLNYEFTCFNERILSWIWLCRIWIFHFMVIINCVENYVSCLWSFLTFMKHILKYLNPSMLMIYLILWNQLFWGYCFLNRFCLFIVLNQKYWFFRYSQHEILSITLSVKKVCFFYIL